MEKRNMPGVGLGVIILNELGEVLLLLRNSEPEKALSNMHLEGTWTLPAGKVKYGETLKEAAVRKVKQETNLDIDKDSLVLVSVADDINEYDHFVTFGFLARSYEGQIDLGDTLEQVDYKFYPLESLPINLCDPSKKIISNYLDNCVYRENESFEYLKRKKEL